MAQTSGWTQQEVEDKQLDSDSELLTGEEEGEWVEEGGEGEDRVLDQTQGSLVGEGTSEAEEEEYTEPPEEAKLFVGGIPFDITTDKLAELFNQAGIVEIAEV